MRRRPAGLEGKLLWSVFDHAGHLADIDDLHFRRFKEILASVETMSPAEKDNLSTTAAHYNRQPLGPILARFRTERTTMINFLSNLTEEDFGKSSRHPRLGAAMRVIDVAEFVAEHDDHHLAVIRDLIWNPASHGAQQAY